MLHLFERNIWGAILRKEGNNFPDGSRWAAAYEAIRRVEKQIPNGARGAPYEKLKHKGAQAELGQKISVPKQELGNEKKEVSGPLLGHSTPCPYNKGQLILR
jgi:hypothetical protein